MSCSYTYFPQEVVKRAKLPNLLVQERKVEDVRDEDGLSARVRYGDQMEFCILSHYTKHLQHFFWRETLLRLVISYRDHLQISGRMLRNLVKVLQYMDNVFNVIAKEARKFKDAEGKCRSNWHSVTFDKYLAIEYHVRRHELALVREWQRNNGDVVLDRVNVADISKSTSHSYVCMHQIRFRLASISFGNRWEVDWRAYAIPDS